MSTNNIGFYEDLTKIIVELSSNMHLISSADTVPGFWMFAQTCLSDKVTNIIILFLLL